jgi:phenylalanyl-tRNA synthetase beta chain
VIRGVKVGPSPAWLARRLEAVGLRPISNVVDVTNYVMFELGQPLHAFDYDRLEGRRIVVRRARAGEKLVAINSAEAKLTPDMLVIADAARPVALAGVMGGLDSEVSGRTVNVLLESARFDPLSVRKTARALDMRSDSSYRFERGIDPTLARRASLRAAQLIQEIAGGELLKGTAEAGQEGYKPKKLSLRLARIPAVLGIDIGVETVTDLLGRLQLSPTRKGSDAVEVTVPPHRLDLNLEIDLVEEVARVTGYDKVPVRDEIAIRVTPPEPAAAAMETVRSAMVAAGYFEAITVGFVSDALAADFVPPEAGKPETRDGAVRLPLPRAASNVRKEDAYLRPSLVPGLLQSVRHNEKQGTPGAKLFETGSTFWYAEGGRVEERQRLTFVGSADVREVRGVVEVVLGKLDATRHVTVVPEDRPGFARGAAGRIEWGGEVVGHLGKVAKSVVDKLSLREHPAAAELELSALLRGAQLVPQLKPLPRFPAVDRDLSLDLAEQVRFEQLESLVRRVNPQWLEELRYVTTYRGKPLEKGHKSITIKLVFRSPTETLTSEQVEASVGRVTEAAKKELGATLRT